MIVVDSSAFIEYYRPSGNPEVRKLIAQEIANDLVAVNGIIRVELGAFAASQKEFDRLTADFSAFHWLELEQEDFLMASQLGFNLRRIGLTVPPTDLIIAASTIRADATLYHLDAHFEDIARHSNLSTVDLRSVTSEE